MKEELRKFCEQTHGYFSLGVLEKHSCHSHRELTTWIGALALAKLSDSSTLSNLWRWEKAEKLSPKVQLHNPSRSRSTPHLEARGTCPPLG